MSHKKSDIISPYMPLNTLTHGINCTHDSTATLTTKFSMSKIQEQFT